MKKSLLGAAAAVSGGNGAASGGKQGPLSMSYDVTGSQQQHSLKQNQSNSLNTRKTLTNFQIHPQTTTTQQQLANQAQFEILKDGSNTRKSVDFKQLQRKANEASGHNKLALSQNGHPLGQRASPDHSLMFNGGGNQPSNPQGMMTSSKFAPSGIPQGGGGGHKRQLSVKQNNGQQVPLSGAPASVKFNGMQQHQAPPQLFYPVPNGGVASDRYTIDSNQPHLQGTYASASTVPGDSKQYDSRHSLHIQNKYSSSGAASYNNSQERVKQANNEMRASIVNKANAGIISESGHFQNGIGKTSSQPPVGKIFAAYPPQGPSPNITNRALSLSTNLGKPGQSSQGSKSKQQSIQSIYSEKNQPQIMIPHKQSATTTSGNSAGQQKVNPLSQSIDLYKNSQGLHPAGITNLIYNQQQQITANRYQDISFGGGAVMHMNGGANSALGQHPQNALLLSDANTNSSYLRQKKSAGGKFASAHSNTPQLNTPNRSIDFSTKAASFFSGNSGIPSQIVSQSGSGYQFKNQPIKANGVVNGSGNGSQQHKKNAMSLVDYQQVSSSFLDQNLATIMKQQPLPQEGMVQQHRKDFYEMSQGAMIAGRFSVQQRPVQGNITPDLIGKYQTQGMPMMPGGVPQMSSTFQQQLFLQQQQHQANMYKMNQSMNSNYGGIDHSAGTSNILMKKSKKRKNHSGLAGNNHFGFSKTPLDFESSLSSNSALLMVDGGTGSEGVNLKQQQLMQQMGIPFTHQQQQQQHQQMLQYNNGAKNMMILRQSHPQQMGQQQFNGSGIIKAAGGSSEVSSSSHKASKISINSLQKSKDRIQQIKNNQHQLQHVVAPQGSTTSTEQNSIKQNGQKHQQPYPQRYGGSLNESEDQLEKLCLQDVTLKGTATSKKPSKVKSKTMTNATPLNGGNSTLRKSLNITEEALAIGKIPPEEIARMIARGQITANNLPNCSPRTREMAMISRAIRECFYRLQEPPETTTDFYRAGKMLGRGAFGKVCLGMHKLTRKLVAIKSINKEYLSEEKQKNKVMHEVGILLRLNRHPNVVKLFETFETGRHILLVMELCAGGDLLNYVRKRKKLDEDIAKYLFKQIIEGLGYLHSKSILHRDIKLDNILLDGKGQVKIADFGVSKLVKPNEIMREQCGTPAYIAPEIIKDQGYTGFKADLWSAGVVLYAMLYGTVPFKANNMPDLHKLILQAKYNLKEDASESAKSLVRALLEPDPLKRFTIKQVLQHPWMKDADDLKQDIFNEEELEIIRREFTYNNPSRFNRNEVPSNPDAEPWDCFTELNLDSMNATLRNASTKSVILAPFNSSVSDDREFETINKRQAPLVDKKSLIKFAARCRDQDRQYEINNNCELDNGVYHKFVYSSHDGAPVNQENPGAATGLKMPQEGEEGGFDEYNSPPGGLRPPRDADGAQSTKMKQSTRNNMKAGANGQESFMESFERAPSENYEELERRIQSAKLQKRATNQLLPSSSSQMIAPVEQPEKANLKPPANGLNKNSIDTTKSRHLVHEAVTSSEQPDDSDTFSSNYSFVIEAQRVQVLVDFGYQKELVYKYLQENDANYCTAGYYLLGLDQNY